MAYGLPSYGKLAENIACGIKAQSEYPIQLVTTQYVFDSMDNTKEHLFDVVTILPDNELYIFNGVKEVGLAKCYMDLYSVFEETVFIDADSLCTTFINPDTIFKYFELTDFAVSNFGIVNVSDVGNAVMSQWTSNVKVKSIGLGEQYSLNIHSCFLYFKKDKTKSIFKESRDSYKEIKAVGYHNVWFNSVPDELMFAAGISRSGYKMLNENLEPVCFVGINNRNIAKKAPILQSTPFITFSSGQNVINHRIKLFYNDIAQMCNAKLGLKNTYNWIDKRDFKPLRDKPL